MTSIRISTLVIALGGLLFAGEAHAQIATMYSGQGYFGVSAGAIIPQDLHTTVTGADSASLDLSFKTGAAFTGFVGYHVNPQLAVEAELGYATADSDAISGTINGVPGSVTVGGHINSVLGFGNVLWKPLGYRGLSPYLGGGIGFANIDSSVDSIAGTSVVGASSNETDFAAQLIAGIDFPVSDRISIGGRYRFVWVNSGATATDGIDTVKQDDFTAHMIMVTGTFRF